MVLVIIFVFGLCIGSFLNVCIFRLPKSRSILRPGSSCPTCNAPIRFYDNIPVLSYLWLKGKCRCCGRPISARYPLVELLTGLSAWGSALVFGISLTALVYFIFISALIVTTFIDIDHRIIPDFISLPGILVGLCASLFLPDLGFLNALAGVVMGGGILFVIAWGYRLLTGKEGMGGGDIKLLAMIGAFTGWKGVFFTIIVSSVSGTLVGLTVMLIAKKDLKYAIPFGPFLALGAVLYVFFGPTMIAWYYDGLFFQF